MKVRWFDPEMQFKNRIKLRVRNSSKIWIAERNSQIREELIG